jgi:hypothetical protein
VALCWHAVLNLGYLVRPAQPLRARLRGLRLRRDPAERPKSRYAKGAYDPSSHGDPDSDGQCGNAQFGSNRHDGDHAHNDRNAGGRHCRRHDRRAGYRQTMREYADTHHRHGRHSETHVVCRARDRRIIGQRERLNLKTSIWKLECALRFLTH